MELCLPLPTDVKKSHECNGFKNQITYLFELKAKACCGFLFGQLPCAWALLLRRTSSANLTFEPCLCCVAGHVYSCSLSELMVRLYFSSCERRQKSSGHKTKSRSTNQFHYFRSRACKKIRRRIRLMKGLHFFHKHFSTLKVAKSYQRMKQVRNQRDQAQASWFVLVFSSDWLKGRCTFSRPITSYSEAELPQSNITFDIKLKAFQE